MKKKKYVLNLMEQKGIEKAIEKSLIICELSADDKMRIIDIAYCAFCEIYMAEINNSLPFNEEKNGNKNLADYKQTQHVLKIWEDFGVKNIIIEPHNPALSKAVINHPLLIFSIMETIENYFYSAQLPVKPKKPKSTLRKIAVKYKKQLCEILPKQHRRQVTVQFFRSVGFPFDLVTGQLEEEYLDKL